MPETSLTHLPLLQVVIHHEIDVAAASCNSSSCNSPHHEFPQLMLGNQASLAIQISSSEITILLANLYPPPTNNRS